MPFAILIFFIFYLHFIIIVRKAIVMNPQSSSSTTPPTYRTTGSIPVPPVATAQASAALVMVAPSPIRPSSPPIEASVISGAATQSPTAQKIDECVAVLLQGMQTSQTGSNPPNPSWSGLQASQIEQAKRGLLALANVFKNPVKENTGEATDFLAYLTFIRDHSYRRGSADIDMFCLADNWYDLSDVKLLRNATITSFGCGSARGHKIIVGSREFRLPYQ